MQKYFKTSVFLLLAAVFLAVACKHTVNNTPLPVYTVSFDLNGGGGVTINAKKITKNEKVTKPTETPTRAHYVFQHWSKTKEGAAYDFSAPVTENFRLYAVWKKVAQYTVNFNLDGGEGKIAPQTIESGKTVVQPIDPPTRSGFTFKHWSTEAGGSIYDFKTPVTSNFTLYAVWKQNDPSTPAPKKFTVSFNLNGGDGTPPADQSIDKDGKVTQPADPLRNDYTFKYWSQTKDGTAYNFDTPVTNSFNLYAVWDVIRYTVTFNYQNGTPDKTEQVEKGNAVSQPTPAPVKDGFNFKYWSTEANGSTPYNFDTAVTGDLTLYAVWEAEIPKFTITVQSDNGSAAQTHRVKQGEKLPKLPNAKKKGTLFKHWSKTQNGTEVYNFDDPVTESFTLYAVYYEIPAGQKRIYDIQGTQHESLFKDQNLETVPGIVTAITYSAGVPTGFYLQDQDGDNNAVTSDGICVYCGQNNTLTELKVGDAVTVSGKVAEYSQRPYKAPKDYDPTTRLTVTQLMSEKSKIQIKSHDNARPNPIKLTPANMVKTVATGAIGSLDPDMEAIDFYESVEGMRVTVEKPKIVAEANYSTYYIAPYNADGFSYRGGMMKPKYDSEGRHVAAALIPLYTTSCFATKAEAGVVEPSATIGDSYEGDITGVMSYYNDIYTSTYQIVLTEKLPALHRGNIMPEESHIQFEENKLNVVSYNLKNFSAGNEYSASEFKKHGYNNDKERAAQFAKHFINGLKAPDIICLIEIQDDNGTKKLDVTSSEETLNLLIEKMGEVDNSKSYDKVWINPEYDVDGGASGANIRCAYLYRTDRVELVPDEDGISTTADASDTKAEIIAGGMKLKANPARIGIGEESFKKCRKSLVGHFKFKDGINDGKDFFMINNHFSSKRGDTMLWGAVQPPLRQSDAKRHQQAQIVKTFIDSILTARSDAMIVSVGDYNDFWFSETMNIMKGSNMKNAIESLPDNERYTFVYNACSQTLDNILVPNRPEVRISGADVLNVNSEFGGKLSDHDPVFVQLSW